MEQTIDLGTDGTLVPGAAPGVSLSEIVRYGQLFGEIVAAVNMAKKLHAGEDMQPGTIKLRINGNSYTWNLGTLKRE